VSATHTPIPSASSIVKANRCPSGAKTGRLTWASAGSDRSRSAPSLTRRTDSPLNLLVRCRAPSTGSIRKPASLTDGLASIEMGGCGW